MSLGKAAEMAGLSYRAFRDYLVYHNVPVVAYDEKDLADDLDAYARWKSGQ